MTDIEQYLRNNKPEMPEEGHFLIETNVRLSRVEGVKDCVSDDRHRSRTAMIMALMTGLLLGCLAALLVMLYPLPHWDATRAALTRFIESLQEYKDLFLGSIAICAIALGVVFVTRKRGAF